MTDAEKRTRDIEAAAQVQIDEERNQKGAQIPEGPQNAQIFKNPAFHAEWETLQRALGLALRYANANATDENRKRYQGQIKEARSALSWLAVLRPEGDKPAPAGTHEDPIRYEQIEKDDPNRQAKLAAQRDQFTADAKAGRVLCLSDLMISHGM
jgi:hypothetical protein